MADWPEENHFNALTHEVYHAVQASLRHIEAEDEEVGAYLMQFFIRKLSQKLAAKQNDNKIQIHNPRSRSHRRGNPRPSDSAGATAGEVSQEKGERPLQGDASP